MKALLFLRLIFICSTLSLFILGSCNKQPYISDYGNVKGYVIAKEICKNNDDDYWLIDFTYPDFTQYQYGDTLILNGTKYTNVIKTKDLDQGLKKVGMAVSIDFKTFTPNQVETTGCIVSNPTTYKLKEIFIINQFEIR